MENNVTNEMRAAIFAAYQNAKIDTDTFVCRQVGISYENAELVLRATGGVISDAFIHHAKDCKLLLYDLSDITEEICIKLSELLYEAGGGDWFGEEDKGAIVDFCKMIVGQYESDDKDFFEAYDIEDFGNGKLNIAAIIDYLRSEKYDCGYSNIPSLITAGIAIKLKR